LLKSYPQLVVLLFLLLGWWPHANAAPSVWNVQISPTTVQAGQQQSVSWQSSNQAWYFFYLHDQNDQPVNTSAFLSAECQAGGSNGSEGCLGTSYPSANTSDTWTIATQIPAGTYKIKVAVWDSSAQAVGAFSAPFTITMSCSVQSEIPEAECNTLVALYNNTKGPNWSDSATNNWNKTNTPCSWTGVVCSSGRVVEITRNQKNLKGTLPDLSALTALRVLKLSYQYDLGGTIPDLSALTALEELDLSYNRLLNGSIPDLSNLTHLRRINLWRNQLTGSIPDLSNLTALESVLLGENQLSGNLPNLSNLTALRSFDAHSNQLSGSIPNLVNLPTLSLLRLNDNQLTGSIPHLSNLTGLTSIRLAHNKFTGNIPDLSNLVLLYQLDLGDNQLTGNIPDLSNLTSLQTLKLYHNQLSGSIPELSSLSALRYLDLSDNQLTGTIPDLSALTSLRTLLLNNNLLSGSVPYLTHMTALEAYSLANSGLNITGLLNEGSLGNDSSSYFWGEYGDGKVLKGTEAFETSLNSPTWIWLSNTASYATFKHTTTIETSDEIAVTFAATATGSTGQVAIDVFVSVDGSNWRLLNTIPARYWFGYGIGTTKGNPGIQGNELYIKVSPASNPTGSLLIERVNMDIISPSLCAAQSEIPEAECNTLVALYDSTDGPNWSDSATNNWNKTNTPCSWTGVTCNGGRVTEIIRQSQNLNGNLPDLSALTQLQVLNLYNNQLSGTLPDLSALTQLQKLSFSSNQLSGSLPDLSALTQLQSLYLYNNQLSGTIPSELGNLANLTLLSLGVNQLSGTIPSELNNLVNLTGLYLSDNQLSGSIPELSALTQLTVLHLFNNQLSGSIPELSALTQLYNLGLSSNQLSGTIPDLSSLTALTITDLGYNQLTGETAGSATAKDSDWANTQTVPPTNVTATALSVDTIRVSWTPIAYTGDGGYYQVKGYIQPGGPYIKAATTTADKLATSYDVTGLSPATLYYFVVETVTPAHGDQQNDLTSALSTEISAVTLSSSSTGADLVLGKNDSADPVPQGNNINYTLTVGNAGPDVANDIQVTDNLPAGLTFNSASGTGWTCNESSGTITCTLAASLAPGTTAEAMTINATSPATGTFSNTATVTSSTTDSDSANNNVSENTTVILGIDDLMSTAGLVEKVETGAQVDIAATASHMSGTSNGLFATWTKTLNTYQSSDWWTTFPNVTLRFAMTATGDFYVGAEGDSESVLSVLTDGGISTSATWGYSVQAGDLVSPWLKLDARANLLAQVLQSEYKTLVEGNVITSGGPQLVYAQPHGSQHGYALLGFEDLPFSLKNQLGAPIKVLASLLYMYQSDTVLASGSPYDGTAATQWPSWQLYNAYNQKWNPKPADTTNGSGSRSFTLSASGTKMYYSVRADGDNNNSGSVILDGTTVSSFSNWDSASHTYRQAGVAPSSIVMNLTNNWSGGQAYFRIAVLEGSLSVSNESESPTGGLSNNPSPLVWTVPTGWNEGLCSSQTDMPEAECNTLVALYNNTNGPNWADSPANNWTQTNTPCSWTGVTCSGGRVTQILRQSQNFNGTIPDLSTLTQLQVLDLHNNQLSGNIPDLSTLTQLQRLWLNSNQLSGNIPDLSAMTQLQWLELGYNQLSGSIPDLNALTQLQYLLLFNNQLSGNIPDLSALTQLQSLQLYNNQLSGNIPDLSTLTQLQYLWLHNNQLSGNIPDLSGLTALSTSFTDLGYNQLTGETAGSATAKDPDWADTQTIPPTNVTATATATDTVKVTWTPIAYTGDGGYYQVKGALQSGGPYIKAATTTADKLATSYEATGLSPGTTYYLVVETFTPAHASQQNDLTSALSAEVSVTTTQTSTDLSITKVGSADPVNSGQALSYTLTVQNNGPNAAGNIQVTDTLPTGLTYNSATGTGWTCSESSGTVTCDLAALASGAKADVITINVTAPVTTSALTLTNTATVSSATTDSDSSNNNVSENTTFAPNQAPVLSLIGNQTVNVGNQLSVTASATDPDGNNLTYSLVKAPTGATLNPTTGELTWTPSNAGTFNATVKVTDDGAPNLSAEETITINVITLCQGQTEIPEAECNTLVALYNNTDGPNWNDSATNNWTQTNTPCSWTGVTCSGGRVTSIDRGNNKGLNGSLPDLSALTQLQYLSLEYNQLSGSIPGLSTLTQLRVLILENNQLSGSIPDLSALTQLQSLRLNNNQLSGSIPDLSAMTQLQYLSLEYNQLSGSIPDLGALTQLQALRLENNQLSGSIPDLSVLTQLRVLSLEYNQLSGSIPDLSALTQLRYLSLSNNQLSGNLPDLGALTQLQGLGLSNNQLSGTIPDLSSLTALSTSDTDLGYNQLTGETAGSATAKDSDWADTQTVPPTNVTATATATGTVKVTWAPIAYTGDGGYYQVKYATTSGGPYTKVASTTADKLATSYDVTGLSPGTAYYFVVETFTPAHGDQQNDLTSVLSAEVSMTTQTRADLSITKADSADPVNSAQALSYTLTVQNNGPNAASNIQVIDTLPSGLTYNSATGTGWTCNENSGTVTCDLAALASGATADVITINVTAQVTTNTLTLNNTATVSSATTDPDSSNNNVSESTTVALNQAPVLSAIGNQTVIVANLLSVTASATDPDGNNLTYSLVNAPTGATLNPTTGELTWTPSNTGPFNATVKVTDDGAPNLSDEETITINVTETPPTFQQTWGSQGSGNGEFNRPVGIAVDSDKNIYVADTNNHRIQQFDSNGNFLSQWGSQGTGDGQFDRPQGLTADTIGHIYVADTGNHRIQKFDSNGQFLLKWGTTGNGNGQIASPIGITVDITGQAVYVTDANHRVQKFASDGNFLTQWGSLGTGDGEFDQPTGIATDAPGQVYVADSNNNRIQKFDSDGNYLTQWGTTGTSDGEFNNPICVVVDNAGDVFVSDAGNHRLQKFDSDGHFLTQLGSNGNTDGQFNQPMGLAASGDEIYVTDSGNNRVQRFDIHPTNRTPVLSSISPQTTVVGNRFEMTMTATDSDGNNLSYSLVNAPTGASIDSSSGVLTWTPNTTGTFAITVKVTDDGTPNLTETKTFTMTVLPSEADLAISQTESADPITEGNTLSYTLTVNNLGPAAANQVQLINTLPANVSLNSVTGTDWACNQSGNTVTCDLAALAVGTTANPITVTVLANSSGTLNNTATVSSSVTDPNSANNSRTATTTVTAANQAPVLSPIGNQTVTLGDTLNFTVSATDLDGDNLSFSLPNPLAGATIEASSGELSWTPGTTGTFELTVNVIDDGIPSLSDEQTFSITVTPANQAPVLENIRAQLIALGSPFSFTASATDPDGDNLSFSLPNPLAGATIDATSGELSWTPGITGTFDLTVNVTDDGFPSLSDEQTFSITVHPVNLAPVLENIGDQLIALGSPFSFTVSATDPDGNSLTFSLENAPAGATMDANSGLFSWTPNTVGTFNVTIKVTDDGIPLLTNEKTFSITVVPATNLSITQTASSETITAGGQMTYTLTVHNAGPEEATNVKVEDTLPTEVTYNSATGTEDWTCAEDGGTVTCELPSLAAGTTANPITVNVTVSDTVSGTLSNRVSVSAANAGDTDKTNATEDTIVVTENNQSPTVNSLVEQSVVWGETVSFTVSATDPEGDNLTFSLEKAPFGATLNRTTGEFTWIPDSYGTFEITVKVTDDGYPPLSAQKSFTITVSAEANLGITQHAVDWITTTADSLTYTLMVNNQGPNMATNVTVVNTLPAELTLLNASGTDWACQEYQGVVTCTLARLMAGATAQPLRVTVSPTTCGTFSHTASVSSAMAESDNSNNQLSDYFTVNCLLAAKPSPTRNGSVQIEPAQKAYSVGETVTLTATPKSCYEFSHWAGACEGSEAVCTLTMNADLEVTAHFSPKVLDITTSADNGTIEIEPAQTEYRCHDEITLTANSAPGYTFLGWSEDLTGQETPRELRLTENLNIIALFGQSQSLSITPLKVNAYPGQKLSFRAEGGAGDFFWTATQGSLTESGNSATYSVPEQGVFYVWVTDGEQFAWALVETPADETQEELLVLLRIVPNAINLSVGETQTVSVKGYRINGTSVDLTADSLLRSENTDILQVNSDGQVTARAYGKTRLTAHYRELHAEIPVTVQDETRVLSVEPNVLVLHEGATALVNVYSVSSLGTKTRLENAKLESRDSGIAAVTQGMVKGLQTGSTWLDVYAGETRLSIPLVVRPSPKLDITPAFASVEQGDSVTFSLSGGQPPYEMTASDGTRLTQVDKTFSYQSLTTGQITVTVTDSLGHQTEAQVETVASLKVTPERAVVTRGDRLELQAIGGAAPYTWSLTQGELSQNEGEQVTYTASTRSGLHTVTVTDNIGNSQDIIILVGDELSLSQQQLFLVPNDKTQIQILGGVPNYSVTVTAGQARLDEAEHTVNYTAPEVAGVYTLTVADREGNEATAEIMLTLELLITPAAGRVDAGESLTFQAAGGVGDKRWFATQGNFDKTSGDAVVWTAPNRFGTAHINVSDAAGAIATATIEVSSLGLAITPAVRHIHPGESAEFTVTGGGAPYTWQLEEGNYTEIADNTIRYTAPSKKGTYQVTVRDAAGKEAQAQAKVYSTRLLASPRTLYIRSGETLKIAIGGGTGDYPALTARFGQLKDTRLSLPDEEVSITTEYTAPDKYEAVYDTITIRDSGGNLATIDVEITKPLDIISTYVGEDGQVDKPEMEKALADFFNQQFWLIDQKTLLLDRKTLFLITEKFLQNQ
jgi:uncharacterized repeat protein (TIGR01451 family)